MVALDATQGLEMSPEQTSFHNLSRTTLHLLLTPSLGSCPSLRLFPLQVKADIISHKILKHVGAIAVLWQLRVV